MRLVVADTSPLVYLILIDHIEIVPRLFEVILVPDSVHAELLSPSAPAVIQHWARNLPPWVEINKGLTLPDDAALQALGAGERSAIALAISIRADLVLIDERKGTQVAIERGLNATGTLGILQQAGRRGMLNLAEAFDRLKRTNFRYRQEIMDDLLREQS